MSFFSSLSSLCSPASSLLFTKLLFRVWLWSHEAVCVREMHLNLPIRVSQCYTHPDNPQFTISEIDQVQSLLNLTHGAEARALCWTLLSTVPTTVWVGPEGIKRSLLLSLSPLLFRSSIWGKWLKICIGLWMIRVQRLSSLSEYTYNRRKMLRGNYLRYEPLRYLHIDLWICFNIVLRVMGNFGVIFLTCI